MSKEKEGFLLRKIALRTLVAINGSRLKLNCATLVRRIGCTYSYGIGIVDKLEKMKLITYVKTGREKLVSITPAGVDVRERLLLIQSLTHKSL